MHDVACCQAAGGKRKRAAEGAAAAAAADDESEEESGDSGGSEGSDEGTSGVEQKPPSAKKRANPRKPSNPTRALDDDADTGSDAKRVSQQLMPCYAVACAVWGLGATGRTCWAGHTEAFRGCACACANVRMCLCLSVSVLTAGEVVVKCCPVLLQHRLDSCFLTCCKLISHGACRCSHAVVSAAGLPGWCQAAEAGQSAPGEQHGAVVVADSADKT